MERKIESFCVNHEKLLPGLYVSRQDLLGERVITTYDMRLTAPNREPVLQQPGVHTLEHLGATYLRNSKLSSRVIYFGPMGCRTGFYLILEGDTLPEDLVSVIAEMLDCVIDFTGDIPGATAKECGNYLDHDLRLAQEYARAYKEELLENKRFRYDS